MIRKGRRRVGPALAAWVVVAFAVPSATAQELSPVTVDDVLAFKAVGAPVLSPDGGWVAFTVTVRDLEDNRYDADVWVVPSSGERAARQLTRSVGFDGDPQWSADGSWLAFRSDRGDLTQVYGIDPRGGEAWAVTASPTAVDEYALSPDGRRIAYLATAEPSEYDRELEKLRGRPVVVDSAYTDQWSHLWVADLVQRVAGERERWSHEASYVTAMVWSPDSRHVAWAARPSTALMANTSSALFTRGRESVSAQELVDLPGRESPVAWTRTLGVVTAGSGHQLGTYNQRLWSVDPKGVEPPRSLTEALDENARFVAAVGEHLLVEVQHGTIRRLYKIGTGQSAAGGAPAPERLSDDASYYSNFSASRAGDRVAFLAQAPDRAAEVHASKLAAFAPRKLTAINPHAEQLRVGETRVVRWLSEADGEEIEGVLTLPVDYREGDRVPLLLRIHGGPSGVSTLSYHGDDGTYPTQVFAGMGYAVLQPNYRGSTGYGERFRGLNRGDISGRDWVDIESGVNHLIREGIADPDRLGIMGWSFGGHHTYWGITRTDRFKAASAGAGANDLISMYHQTDLPGFYHTYLGPAPWEDFDLYEERSAYRFVERVTTPLLIQVGENDARVPKEQSIQFYSALKEIGRAPAQLVIYPGQPHGVREPRLQRDLMERNLAWFQRWIPVRTQTAAPEG